MASPHPPPGAKPCPVCGGHCGRFPDLPTDDRNPFITGAKPPPPEPKPQPHTRPKGKRRPAEDRAHHGPKEDR